MLVDDDQASTDVCPCESCFELACVMLRLQHVTEIPYLPFPNPAMQAKIQPATALGLLSASLTCKVQLSFIQCLTVDRHCFYRLNSHPMCPTEGSRLLFKLPRSVALNVRFSDNTTVAVRDWREVDNGGIKAETYHPQPGTRGAAGNFQVHPRCLRA
jgi:hypothetical protein